MNLPLNFEQVDVSSPSLDAAVGEYLKAPQRRIAALLLPELLIELTEQQLSHRELVHTGERSSQRSQSQRSQSQRSQSQRSQSQRSQSQRSQRSQATKAFEEHVSRADPFRRAPTAVVLVGASKLSGHIATNSIQSCSAALERPEWDAKTRLDAVNSTARRFGVRPRQTIAEASAIISNLEIIALQPQHVLAALRRVAEVTLAFGSPVSFQAPDTIWVDITGTVHLFGSEHALVTELASATRALGHTTRVSVASGPWLARAFARYGCFDETGISSIPSGDTLDAVKALPIVALPIDADAVAWFSRLGLLTLGDLNQLPSSALACRLNGQLVAGGRRSPEPFSQLRPSALPSSAKESFGVELGPIGDLMRGQDDSVLIPYQPEELPFEELCWDEPLDTLEPLLFILKGLAGRLAARLEGRGQATRELVLRIHHERSIFSGMTESNGAAPAAYQELRCALATPMGRAEELERTMRSRLQREVLLHKAVGLTLQASSLTNARCYQLGLSATAGLGPSLSTDPKAMAMLIAELAADIGPHRVGRLATGDSHLLEKTSCLTPFSEVTGERVMPHRSISRPAAATATSSRQYLDNTASHGDLSHEAVPHEAVPHEAVPHEAVPHEAVHSATRLPTRLLSNPLVLNAPFKTNELWILQQQPFVVERLEFEERVEAVEWWQGERVFRDYFRVWLSPVNGRARAHHGLEVLAYMDRVDGKTYLQALYD